MTISDMTRSTQLGSEPDPALAAIFPPRFPVGRGNVGVSD